MNILLVNTNQISIRFVEELLAKNNIHGEIAMVRAGKFALDLVQGMHVDLLVCEIENETKEKTKHFLSESRKMTPDAYYFVLMDGESLEYMEEDFLNALDDFITIPFEDRALKLRLNRGILACIEKKKKAGMTAGRPSTKAAETMPVNAAPVKTGDADRMTPEIPVKPPESHEPPPSSKHEPVPVPEMDADTGKLSTPGRRVPREEFQYEPSYEELLQQRNKILRKEKEAAWLQTMSSQISSYAQDEEIEKPIRVREDRKPDPILPSNEETHPVTPPASEATSVLEPGIPNQTESMDPQPVKRVQNEAQQSKPLEPEAETPKVKSVVKSLFESLSKLKMKSNLQNPQPLLASAEAGVEDKGSIRPLSPELDPEPRDVPVNGTGTEQAVPDIRAPLESNSSPSSEPAVEPLAETPADSPVDQPISFSDELASDPSTSPTASAKASPPADPSIDSPDDHSFDSPDNHPIGSSADHSIGSSTDSMAQEEMGFPVHQDMEDPVPSDDGIPEESFLDSPVTDEEYIQEILPIIPHANTPDVTETAPEENPFYAEENTVEEPLVEAPAEEQTTMPDQSEDDLSNQTERPEDLQVPNVSSRDLPEETQHAQEVRRFEETQSSEEIVDDLQKAEESGDETPVTEGTEDDQHEDRADMTPEVFPDPSDFSSEPEPETEPDVPASRIGMPIEIDGEAYGQADEDTGESIPSTSPSQVSHLQDEIWMDPTEPFIFEPDESADDADAPFADIVEEQEIFGIEEDADLSLMAEEDPLLEEVLVLPLEEDPLTTPETLPEAILDSDDWATSSNLEKRASEDPPAAADSLTSSSSTKADSAPPLEEMSVLEKPGDQPGPVFQTEIPDVPPLPQEEIPAEDTPEQAPPVPLLEEVTAPPKKDSLDLRQYLKEPKEEETKGLKSKFRKTFGKKPPS